MLAMCGGGGVCQLVVVERFELVLLCVFFFSSRRRHTRCSRDWSSDVCSSDLWSGTCAGRYRSSGAPRSRTWWREPAGRRARATRCCCRPRAPATTCSRITRSERSEEHTSELQSRLHLVCRLLLEKKKKNKKL